MKMSNTHKGFLGAALIHAGIYGFFGVGAAIGLGEGNEVNLAGGLSGISVAAAIVVGVLLSLRWPLAGGILMVILTLPFAVLTFWFFLIPPVVALIMLYLGYEALHEKRSLQQNAH